MIDTIKKGFKDKSLFELALTHKSWVNENPGKRESNERLEFLGDAVLELVVTDHLFRKFPEKSEGYLTNLRANIVNTVNLAKFAQKISVGEHIFLSIGESTSGKNSSSVLADTVEAIIGAIFMDQGLSAAKKFITENILSDLEDKVKEPLKDAKSTLQETVQAQGLAVPKYKVVKTVGPVHDREFTMQVIIKKQVYGEGKGKSKSAAEQIAANLALKKLTS